jgi:hypothetical protein
MNITSISAGSGPAAAILIGGILIFSGQFGLGILTVVAGFGLSIFWAASRFR